MALALRSLLTGLFAGLLLAVVFQQALSGTDLPSSRLAKGHAGSTWSSSEPLAFTAYADMLRNSLSMGRQALRAAGGYKNFRPAVSRASLLPHLISPTPKHLSTSAAPMASTKTFHQAVKDRRTIYQLTKEAPISDKEIVSIAKDALLNVPSSFNSQSSRLVVLLNAEHDKFWDATLEVLKAIVPEDQFGSTKGRIDGFKAAYGTILFFEDPDPVHDLEKKFPLYAHHFPTWSEHTSAMHQYALWVALETEGFGANLQHYNPIVDQKVQAEWNVPQEWALRAQLVFGGKAGEAGEKQFKPVEGERLFVHGAKE